MNFIKVVTIFLALMTTSAFADFTVKDLFVSGGTKTQDDNKDNRSKDEKVRTHQDCI